MALYSLWDFLPRVVQSVLSICVIGIWTVFIIVEIKIICAIYAKNEWIPEYLIVLGAQVRGRKITNSLKRRLDRAFELWEQDSRIKLIVSGGQGKGEDISEAEAMERYLLSRGVVSEYILKEDKSTSTQENLQFSRRLVEDENKKVGIVTNNFHVYRAILLARDIGFKEVCGISAGTNPVLFLNYMVREFLAVLWMHINKSK